MREQKYSFTLCLIKFFDCACVVFLISLDKDECTTREAKCPPYSTCVNTDGSYRCQCESGRILSNNKCNGMITSLYTDVVLFLFLFVSKTSANSREK